MKPSLIRLLLLGILGFTSIGLAGCSFFGINAAKATPVLADAGFQVIDLVENSENEFVVAKDSILLARDAIQLLTTIKANQSPPTNTQNGYIQITILYNKQGVESQDVYRVDSGKASLGILLEGGKTFESFSGNSVDIDATQTQRITIVPLQNATEKVAVLTGKGWQNTGIFLKRGREFQIKYLSGTWTISKKTVGRSDAAGQPVNPPANLLCNCGEPLPGYSTQALIGRIGDGIGYAALQVGDDFSGVSYDNDFLYLRMNLADQLLPYSYGSIIVAVETNNS